MKTITSAVALGFIMMMSGQGRATSLPRGAVPVAPQVPETVAGVFVPAGQVGQKLNGLLAARMHANLNGRLLRVDEKALLEGFTDKPGKHPWIGEHVGKFLDAASRVWLNSHDARLKKLMDRTVRTLIAAQQPDGYLGTYADAQRWTGWDVWVHKYNLLGLLSYHEATGDEGALAAARKVGDLLVGTFGGGKRDLVKAGEHVGMAATSVLGPMVGLYRHTNDRRYLTFATDIIKAYEQPSGPKLVSTLRSSGNVFKTANGKAYEMISNLIGMVDLYAVTGDRSLLDPVRLAWNDIATKRLYVTGTTSLREHFQEEGALMAEQHHNIGETCVTVNWIELTLALMRFEGDAKYAEEIERSVYNHLLGAQDSRNGDFCYYTALNGTKKYGPGISCCVSSGPRGIAMLPELAWGTLQGAPTVVLWTAGQATLTARAEDGSAVKVKLEVQTRFPEDGKVKVLVRPERPAKFTVALRVPEWTDAFTAKLSDGALTGTPGSFLRVTRAWPKSAEIDVDMSLPVRLADGGASYPGRVAVVRGPQVLAALRPAAPDAKAQHPELLVLQLPVSLRAFGRGARQTYKAAGRQLQSFSAGAPARTVDVTLVPYAEARRPQVWLLSQQGLPRALAAAAQREAQRKVYKAKRADEPFKIDGQLDAALSAETLTAMDVTAGGHPASQPAFAVRWDDANLYVAARVMDKTPESRGDDFSSDSVAIAVDGDRVGSGMYGATDVFVLHRSDGKRVVGWNDKSVARASANVPGGYVVEFAVPWQTLGAAPRAGRRIGFEIRNHDQGAPGVDDDGQRQWASAEPSMQTQTSDFGIVELVP